MIADGITFLEVLTLGYQVNKSMKIDEQATKKNIKAFTKTADAQNKLKKCQENAFNKLFINAKRKNGMLTCHLKMFQEQYSIIRKIQFKKGKGIEELERIEEIQDQLNKYVTLPAVSSGKQMTDSQFVISFALRGIGDQMIKDSEMNLKLASSNLSQANAISAQIDSMCIALDGLARHTEIITALLEKLGMLYMKSIKNISEILKRNGLDSNRYSEQDIDAINMSLLMTKLIYRIINTPMIDQNGTIEQESVKVIQEGQQLLDSINKGV